MKKILTSALFLFLVINVKSQTDCEYPTNGAVIESNLMGVKINTDGTLFHHEGEGFFSNPYFGEGSPTTIRKAGLWIGGFEEGTNNQVLKFAAAASNSEDDVSDFFPGPLKPDDGTVYSHLPCNYMNQVWKVTREEIWEHLEDYNEDGIIDDPISSIIFWPGNGNPHFWWGAAETGLPDLFLRTWAPFYDRDEDGIYEPYEGDFPALGPRGLIPNELFWTVFNDEGGGALHEVSNGEALRVEVQLTAYTLSCESQRWVEDMLFTEYKIINRSLYGIDSLHAGIWVDFDLGCPEDDYIGSIPNRNTFYAYNADPIDGNEDGACDDGRFSYEEFPPVMTVSFLGGYEKGLSNFIYYHADDTVTAGKTAPHTDAEFYNYHTGTWRDGTPLTYGGDGYDPGSSNPIERFAFPDKPSETSGWSMFSENFTNSDVYAIGSIMPKDRSGQLGNLDRGQSMKFNVVYGFHRPNTRNHIEIVDRISDFELKEAVFALYESYSWHGPFLCFSNAAISNQFPEEDIIAEPSVKIFPNPTTGNTTISYTGEKVYEVAIYNTNRYLIYFDNNIEEEEKIKLDLSGFQKGVYHVRLTVDGTVFEERLVIF